jgi:Putative peptidoglycan binding domain/D-alanyl-D-alanine carboxypeptidase
MAENGRLSKSELASIPGGELAIAAAAAWNAPGGPADAGLRPTGPRSSYRTFAEQEELWAAYKAGGALAAQPGTSNHGLGIAIDVPEAWMQSWIREHGDAFGWQKTEAMSESWHFNFVGGVDFPTFEEMKKGSHGKRVERLTKRLAFIHEPGGKAFLAESSEKFTEVVEEAVRRFQKAYKLEVDGVVGPKTAARINGVFHHQFEQRGKK